MTKVPTAALLLAALPWLAQAQVYKCPQANGTTGYQSTPCATGAKPSNHPTAAELNAARAAQPAAEARPFSDPYATPVDARPHPTMPPLQSSFKAPPAPPAPPAPTGSQLTADVQARNKADNQRQAAEEAHRKDNSVARQVNCNTARHNLGVLKEQRPVFAYDNKGNKQYVEDKDRAGALAKAEADVASNCN
jgi:hypothetical protein